jgi:hypothetical protein
MRCRPGIVAWQGSRYPRPRISGAPLTCCTASGERNNYLSQRDKSRAPQTRDRRILQTLTTLLPTTLDQRCVTECCTASGNRVQSRTNSAYKSRQSGLRSSMSLIFQSRRQCFTARSRSLASKIEVYCSKLTSRETPYLVVKPGARFSSCSEVRRGRSFVTRHTALRAAC